MSYCRFEAFKVLAKNYLELESHELFGKIDELLGKTKIDLLMLLRIRCQSQTKKTRRLV
ncbi:mitochondrial chaperone BCS1 [Populus alba x Populus x berolinensis]|nr:mitochondrial chaperone BCS1 [Populus alba x Populus x berolinensis]